MANTNFDALHLVDDGIILSHKNQQKKEISFSELDKIYMKQYKLSPLYQFIFILIPFFLIVLYVQYLMIEKVMFAAVFTVIPIFAKTYNYKRNSLVISVKDGTVYRKKVSSMLKNENVSMVNTVRRERLNYYVKTNV